MRIVINYAKIYPWVDIYLNDKWNDKFVSFLI